MGNADSYYGDVFYKTDDKRFETKIEMCREAFKLCRCYFVDELDCKVSFARRNIPMEFEEVMKKVNEEDTWFVCIHRRGFLRDKGSDFFFQSSWSLEVGFRHHDRSKDLFLFTHLDEKYVDSFVKKFELEEMK